MLASSTNAVNNALMMILMVALSFLLPMPQVS